MTASLSSEARRRLDAHLDAVEAALAGAGSSREQRRGIVDDLEAQILDMLAAKNESPTLQDVEAVLATVDPPAAYASGERHAAVPPPVPGMAVSPAARRYSRTAIWGFVCVVLSLVPLVLFLMAFVMMNRVSHVNTRASDSMQVDSAGFMTYLEAKSFSSVRVLHERREMVELVGEYKFNDFGPVRRITTQAPASLLEGQAWEDFSKKAEAAGTAVTRQEGAGAHGRVESHTNWRGFACVVLPLIFLALPGTVLGWVAFFQIRASKGMLRGTGLALFDGLFYPVVALLLLVVAA